MRKNRQSWDNQSFKNIDVGNTRSSNQHYNIVRSFQRNGGVAIAYLESTFDWQSHVANKCTEQNTLFSSTQRKDIQSAEKLSNAIYSKYEYDINNHTVVPLSRIKLHPLCDEEAEGDTVI